MTIDSSHPNRAAFLDMIAVSEGTFGIGDNGYNVLVGSTPTHPLLFSSYADHPRILNKALDSTAAGRYQVLERYYDIYKVSLNLADFSPASQDAIALQQIRESDALDDIDAGNIENAIYRCKHIWASLPGAGYGQREQSLVVLLGAYRDAGGNVA